MKFNNQPPKTPQVVSIPIDALRSHPEQPYPEQPSLAPSFGVDVIVIPGNKHKHGFWHQRNQLQWAASVIAMYCPEEFRAQRINNKSKFTTKVGKLLKNEPDYVARGFRKFPSRRTVMRAWRLVRVANMDPRPVE